MPIEDANQWELELIKCRKFQTVLINVANNDRCFLLKRKFQDYFMGYGPS